MKRAGLTLTPVWLEGVLALTNAVPELSLVIDCVNCGDDRFAAVGEVYDFASQLPTWNQSRRAVYSELKANDMVMGTEEKMRRRVAEIVARRPAAVLLVQSTAVRLIGTDLRSLAEELEEDLGVPMVPVPSPPTDGDWTDGYDQALAALAARVPLEPAEAGGVGLVGHLLTRHEQDDLGNARELRRLFGGLGADPCSLWLDGSSAEGLGRVGRAERLVVLPGGARTAKVLARRTGAELIPAGLPIGLDGTVRWVKAVARALEADDRATTLIDRELERVVPRLDKVVYRGLMHRQVGVVGTPAECVALLGCVLELGMVPTLCVVLTMRERESERVTQLLAQAGHQPKVVVDPEFHVVEAAIGELNSGDRLEVILGSGAARDAAKPSAVPYLELGHPSPVRHALYDAPWWGFHGTLWLAGEVFNLIHEREYQGFRSGQSRRVDSTAPFSGGARGGPR